MGLSAFSLIVFFAQTVCLCIAFTATHNSRFHEKIRIGAKHMYRRNSILCSKQNTSIRSTATYDNDTDNQEKRKKIVVIGAGWGGLSAAYALSTSKSKNGQACDVVCVDASPRPGGVVRDGFLTMSGERRAEAGQHGFWDNYHNIFHLLETSLVDHLPNSGDVLTGYAPQGQYSPNGLEAVWPVYRDQSPTLPTGLAQALYTKFLNLSVLDRASAAPLVLAFSDFDDSKESWEKYDGVSFRDLCVKLGVSRKCYEEAFEPMILTGLFAPGAECSAAAALGMAYFFVLKSQNSFDVRWCRGNVGDMIFEPWVNVMKQQDNPVTFIPSTRVEGFDVDHVSGTNKEKITNIRCRNEDGVETALEADDVVFAVGAAALNAMVRNSPSLAKHKEFRRYTNLRGTSVLATRLYLDRTIPTPYSANACWGFDRGVGMTFFDIGKLHAGSVTDTASNNPGSVIEVDYYHANTLLTMNDDDIVSKAKQDLDTMLGSACVEASVVDAAVVKLPQAVNWYFPGSYVDMPDSQSKAIPNAYFVGDLVRSRHGSWSQEKAYVTGIEAANLILDREKNEGIIPLAPDEPHVAAGRTAVSLAKRVLGGGASLVDFMW